VKVTDLRLRPVRMALDKPIGNATATITEISCIAVFLDTDEGLTGENLIFTIRPEQVPLLMAMVEVLREAVIGKTPEEAPKFWAEAWRRINFIGFTGVSIMGISAIDGALWDLNGKQSGRSIANLLGRVRDRVPTYASAGLWINQTISEIVAQADGFIDSGHTGMKLRLAGNADFDLPRIAAVRQAIGPDVALMVDVNQGLDAKAAIALGQRMAAYDIAWFEEPVPAHDLEASARVAAALDMPIASGENDYARYGFRRLLEARAADIWMPDLQRVGGVTEFHRVSALAAAYDIPVSSHLFPEMSLQVMASAPTGALLEHVDWFAPLYRETLQVVDGHIAVPDGPGWGMTLDPDALAHFARDR
jgi:L-alanine-DL-glutamate epimerase-like enolase superfamily enzyme